MAEQIIDRIADAVLPLIYGAGFDLADAQLVKEGANWYLRFFIENPDPEILIGIDDCERVSEILSDWLDEHDPIPQAYFLEVSSPGIDRPLKKDKDFIKFKGYMVELSCYKPERGKKVHVGILGTVSENELVLESAEAGLAFDRSNIAGVKLYYDQI